MRGALLERKGERDEAGLGEGATEYLKPDRKAVRSESGRHRNRRQPGVRAEPAVVPALWLTDDGRTLAPDRKSARAVSRSSQCAAQSSAVAPSARAVLTSTPWSTSTRTIRTSCSAAALTSRRSCPAAVPRLAAHTVAMTQAAVRMGPL